MRMAHNSPKHPRRSRMEQAVATDVGMPAPDFTLPAHTDEQVRLAEQQGKKIVLLFYVFDFSPG